MKVHQSIQSQVDPSTRAQRPAADPAHAAARPHGSGKPAGTDQVALSDLAAEMRAAAVLDEARHAERLTELRGLIAEDRYQVDPEDVADAILREDMQPWTAK